ncbi:uncharacterized protein LOC116306551 [Actinia tenebrosa]|uniref:Uncharacterized protein LOC116306551 n=1 Tax=Actinia tenebrosa TaxID=6105 RepID=A0A6P8J395_ACTTE|nr:uncharacterized protein LOC116306551 [Actinia tenebrosa]
MPMAFYWAQDDSSKYNATALGSSMNLVSKFVRVLQDVCTNEIEKYAPFLPFGGPGCVVQCDESKFNHKRKYNRGRLTKDSWVFGVITTEYQPVGGYYQVVERRNRECLLPILQRCLKPGSVVLTEVK